MSSASLTDYSIKFYMPQAVLRGCDIDQDVHGSSRSSPAASAWPEPWLVGSKQAWRALGMNLRKETAERVDEWID